MESRRRILTSCFPDSNTECRYRNAWNPRKIDMPHNRLSNARVGIQKANKYFGTLMGMQNDKPARVWARAAIKRALTRRGVHRKQGNTPEKLDNTKPIIVAAQVEDIRKPHPMIIRTLLSMKYRA